VRNRKMINKKIENSPTRASDKVSSSNISRAVMRAPIHSSLSRGTCSALSVRCNSLEHHRERQRHRRRWCCDLACLFSALFSFREIGIVSNSRAFLSAPDLGATTSYITGLSINTTGTRERYRSIRAEPSQRCAVSTVCNSEWQQ